MMPSALHKSVLSKNNWSIVHLQEFYIGRSSKLDVVSFREANNQYESRFFCLDYNKRYSVFTDASVSATQQSSFDLKICDKKIIQSTGQAHFKILRPNENSNMTDCHFLSLVDDEGVYGMPNLYQPHFLARTVITNYEVVSSPSADDIRLFPSIVAHAQDVFEDSLEFVSYEVLDHNSGILTTKTYLPYDGYIRQTEYVYNTIIDNVKNAV